MRFKTALSVGLLSGLLSFPALADVTYELQAGPLPGVSAARGFLVADVNQDGFSAPGPWTIGTVLAPGETIGLSDDVIIAVFGTNADLPWPSDTGFGSVIQSGLEIAQGANLALYWITGSDEGPGSIAADTEISGIIDTGVKVPLDGRTVSIELLSGELGGSLSPGDVETSSTGNAPVDLSLNTETAAVIGAGETLFFEFATAGEEGLVLDLGGNESVSAEIFDRSGNSVATFSNSEEMLPVGSYYLALTETSGINEANLEFLLISSGFQPDLWIGGAQKRSRKNNVYSDHPGKQRYRIDVHRRVSFPLIMENDSLLVDSLRINATRLGHPFREWIVERGQGNVTGAILTGRYSVDQMEGRSSKSLSVRVKAKSGSYRKKRKVSKQQNFYARSVSDPGSRDTISALFLAK